MVLHSPRRQRRANDEGSRRGMLTPHRRTRQHLPSTGSRMEIATNVSIEPTRFDRSETLVTGRLAAHACLPAATNNKFYPQVYLLNSQRYSSN